MTSGSDFKALGKAGSGGFEGIETFDAPAGVDQVVMLSDEVTAVCPVTGQPDYYQVKIIITRPVRCIESKSLKLYFTELRNEGIFCEALAARIAADAAQATQSNVSVEVVQKPRGGISIKASAFVPYQETNK